MYTTVRGGLSTFLHSPCPPEHRKKAQAIFKETTLERVE